MSFLAKVRDDGQLSVDKMLELIFEDAHFTTVTALILEAARVRGLDERETMIFLAFHALQFLDKQQNSFIEHLTRCPMPNLFNPATWHEP